MGPGQKIFSGWVKKYPSQGWVSLSFTMGQKYVPVGSGPISKQHQTYSVTCEKYSHFNPAYIFVTVSSHQTFSVIWGK